MPTRLTATLLTYGEDSTPDLWGDVVRFADGAVYLPDDQAVGLFIQHDTHREAAGVATAVYTEGARVVGEFELLDTPAGRAAAVELAADVRRDVSVGVRFDDYDVEDLDDAGGSWLVPQRLTATAAELVEASLCLRGRMPSARVESVTTTEGNTP